MEISEVLWVYMTQKKIYFALYIEYVTGNTFCVFQSLRQKSRCSPHVKYDVALLSKPIRKSNIFQSVKFQSCTFGAAAKNCLRSSCFIDV